jgi:hypothetical protein
MNVYDLVRNQLTDEALGALAGTLNESRATLGSIVLGGTLPALLNGLANHYGSEADGAALLALLRSGGHDGSILDNLAGALGGGAQTDALLNVAKGHLDSLLDGRSDAVTELLTTGSGARRASVSGALGLTLPIVLGVLGREVQAGRVDGSALALALTQARAGLGAVALPGLTDALGIASFAAAVPAPEPERRGALWPWLIVPAVALTMFFALRSCQQNSMRTAAGPAAIPATPAAPSTPAAAPAAPSPAPVAPPATTAPAPP